MSKFQDFQGSLQKFQDFPGLESKLNKKKLLVCVWGGGGECILIRCSNIMKFLYKIVKFFWLIYLANCYIIQSVAIDMFLYFFSRFGRQHFLSSNVTM